MKINKFLILAIFAALLAVPSCKKEKEDEVKYKNSFKGAVNFALPEFVAPGDVYNLVPSGLTRPEEGKGIGYYWDCPEMKITKDTTRTENDPADQNGALKFTVRDTIGTMSMKCVAFAEGYYTASKSMNFVVIHPTKSLMIEDLVMDAKTYADPRDGRVYKYKKIGNVDWMLENLAYAKSGVSYHECKAMDPVYGRLYRWEEAKTACPEGWRLPSKAEWNELFGTVSKNAENPTEGIAGALMVPAKINHEKMWEFWPEVKITNQSDFSAIPVGYVQYSGKSPKFVGSFQYATFWSTEEYDAEKAVYYYLYMKNPNVLVGSAHKSSFATSVRCVR